MASSGARGVYRIRMGWGTQHSVMVDYGNTQMEISEEKYRENGYEPPFETLHWKDEGGDA
jgi:hypothetical protein